MPYKFNPISGDLDYYVAGTGDAWSDLVDANIVPDGDGTRNVGSSSFYMNNMYANTVSAKSSFNIMNSSKGIEGQILATVTSPSGASLVAAFRNATLGEHIGIVTQDSASTGATDAGNIYIEGGNRTAGTGNGGSFVIKGGTSSGGTPGFVDIDSALVVAQSTAAGTTTLNDLKTVVHGATASIFTLPSAALAPGRFLIIQKTDSDSTQIVLDGSGSETIDGGTTSTLATQYDTAFLISDGTNWISVGRKNRIETKTLSASVTTNTTISDLTCSNLIVGKFYEVRGQFILTNDTSAADANITVTAVSNSVNLAVIRMEINEGSDSSQDLLSLSTNFVFEAGATSLTFVTTNTSANSLVFGDGTRTATYIQIEERNDLAATTAF